MKPSELNKALRRHAVESAQIRELVELRAKLSRLFYLIHTVHSIVVGIDNKTYINVEDVRLKSPEVWQEYMDYKSISLEIYYKFAKDYALIPKWMKREPISAFHKVMQRFCPFTPYSLSVENSKEEREQYMIAISSMIDFIDSTILQAA